MTASQPLSLDQFLDQHPWSAEDVAKGKPLNWLWHYDLDCSADELWPHLIETSRFNRAMGLSKMTFVERDGALFGQSVNGGVRHEWVELPWEWITGRELLAIRRYSRGFGHTVRVIYSTEELGERKHRLYIYFGWIPRGALGRAALKIGMPPLERSYRAVLARLSAELGSARPAPFVAPPPEIPADNLLRMEAIGRKLVERGLSSRTLEKLLEFLRSSDDMDAYRIQVRRLAHQWGIPEPELIGVCLHATREGLLDMSWDVICPHCRGVRDEADRLDGIRSKAQCAMCAIEFGTDLENAVEITFHVHPSLRTVPKVYYCSAQPATLSHVKLQQMLAPGETRAVSSRLRAGRYRMRARGDQRGVYLDVRGGAPPEVSWRVSDAGGEVAAAECARFSLVNDSGEPQMFILEEVRWSDEALRPADLFNLQEFRDLFSEEYLGADVQLAVGEQTILFTDMVGSTSFYAQRGDPAAFVVVRKHFARVFAVVRENRGAIVKTIGDAAMASFSNPVDAVRAARQIHDCFPAKGEGDNGEPVVRLRISLNRGPCIAVNLNSSIDYFGGTVNFAAKLQSCAEGGQIAMSRAVIQAPGVAEFLRDQRALIEDGVFEYKALDPIHYSRWDTDRSKPG